MPTADLVRVLTGVVLVGFAVDCVLVRIDELAGEAAGFNGDRLRDEDGAGIRDIMFEVQEKIEGVTITFWKLKKIKYYV